VDLLKTFMAISEDRRSMCDYELWVRLAGAGDQLGRLQLPLVAKRLHAGQGFMHRRRVRYVRPGLEMQMRAMRSPGAETWRLGCCPCVSRGALCRLR
jgi:hypothetical protein